MRVDIEQNNRTLYVRLLDPRLEGEHEVVDALKAYTSMDLERVELDFASVEYMNSRGITELVSIYRSFNADKTRLHFLNVRGRVRHIMELDELHHIAEIHGNAAQFKEQQSSLSADNQRQPQSKLQLVVNLLQTQLSARPARNLPRNRKAQPPARLHRS